MSFEPSSFSSRRPGAAQDAHYSVNTCPTLERPRARPGRQLSRQDHQDFSMALNFNSLMLEGASLAMLEMSKHCSSEWPPKIRRGTDPRLGGRGKAQREVRGT